jgi:ribosomal protein L1
MATQGKKFTAAATKVDRSREYQIPEAVGLVKGAAFAKFDETVDVAVRLGTVKSRLHYALDTLRRELVPQTKPVDDVALPVPVRPQPGSRRTR